MDRTPLQSLYPTCPARYPRRRLHGDDRGGYQPGSTCDCGKRGCLNAYFSSNGIVNRFQRRAKFEKTTLYPDCNDVSIIAACAHAGDRLCCELFEEAGEKLGVALSYLFNTLCLETVVFFGELTQYKDLYLDACTRTLKENLYKTVVPKIQFSEMGGSSPALGAALTVAESAIEIIAVQLSEREETVDAEKVAANDLDQKSI